MRRIKPESASRRCGGPPVTLLLLGLGAAVGRGFAALRGAIVATGLLDADRYGSRWLLIYCIRAPVLDLEFTEAYCRSRASFRMPVMCAETLVATDDTIEVSLLLRNVAWCKVSLVLASSAHVL